MKYAVLEQFDQETQQLMTKYLETAEVSDLNEIKDFKKFFVAMMDDFMKEILSVDDLSWMCEKLMVIIVSSLKNDKELFHDRFTSTLDVGSDISWYLRNDPVRGGDFIEGLIGDYLALKKDN